MASDVITESDDLLHQLSAELGLPSLLDATSYPDTQDCMDLEGFGSMESVDGLGGGDASGLGVEELSSCGRLEDQIMQDLASSPDQPNHPAIFPELSCGESGYGESVKSEPTSPFPPSPPDSDHSDGGGRRDSPPLSPQLSMVNVGGLNAAVGSGMVAQSQRPFAPIQSVQIQSQQDLLPPSAAAQASKLGIKVPIPKIKRSPSTTAASGPIVLQLGSDGLYYATQQPPPQQQAAATAPPLVVKAEMPLGFCSPLVSATPTITTAKDAEEIRNLKRQQRMIKNRDRKKKKEYLNQLEAQISTLTEENRVLRSENESLTRRVTELQSEKKLWTTSLLNSAGGKKATAVFAIFFMVSLNFNSLSGIYRAELDGDLSAPANLGLKQGSGAGRTLLWADTDYEDLKDDVKNASNVKVEPMCPMLLNQTESIRLESELRGLFNIKEQQRAAKPASARRLNTKKKTTLAERKTRALDRFNSNSPSSRLPPASGSALYHMLVQEDGEAGGNGRSISITQTHRNAFDSFFEAIERRDDTFYVVSFSGDHLLVPALNHSQANRPRMSLLLPALSISLNDSLAADRVAMMKIDCEVMNTQLIQVRQDSIPAHLRSANISRQNQYKENPKNYSYRKSTGQRSPKQEDQPYENDNVTLASGEEAPLFKAFKGSNPSPGPAKRPTRKSKPFHAK